MYNTSSHKKILLIIDPQNDFSSEKKNGEKIIRPNGPLNVPGSNNDYENIAELIKSGKFDEIHISLDTHTINHIGHKGFYNHNGSLDKITNGCKPWEEDIVPTDINLKDYVKKYDEKNRKERGTEMGYCIWETHCLEDTDGHKIVQEVTEALNTIDNSRVRYHIKGQNELTEMYSIFSAAVQPKDAVNTLSFDYRYSGTKSGYYNRGEGVETYEEARNSINLETTMNDELLKNLFGNNNQIYVCGEAKTHCVKDSVLDMIKYSQKTDNESKPNQIYLLEDCTSPIPGFTDDISNTLKKVGGNVVSKEEILYPSMFVIYWILMLLILFISLYIIVSILLYLRVHKIFFKFIRKKR
jgi:nicotinamidase-related amidase